MPPASRKIVFQVPSLVTEDPRLRSDRPAAGGPEVTPSLPSTGYPIETLLPEHHFAPALLAAEAPGAVVSRSLAEAVGMFESNLIQDALKSSRGNRAKAARLLNTTERILRYKARRYGIDPRRFRP